MKNTIKLMAVLVFVATIIGACSKKADNTVVTASTTANNVVMQNIAFVPATLTISKGSTVTWTNKDGFVHTVTADDKSYDSGSVGAGATYQHTYPTAGTYPYVCTVHSSMKGTVIVQ